MIDQYVIGLGGVVFTFNATDSDNFDFNGNLFANVDLVYMIQMNIIFNIDQKRSAVTIGAGWSCDSALRVEGNSKFSSHITAKVET